jgi:pyridoxamine 5'-phosphate oxidase
MMKNDRPRTIVPPGGGKEQVVEIAWNEPFVLFAAWLEEARGSEPRDAEAMTLATADRDGMPAARMVLLKGADAAGFVFYTHMASAKGLDLAANPRAALCFHWKSLARQVRVAGTVAQVSDAEADAYFATRPRGSQIGAWASEQSRPVASRTVLEERVRAVEARFAGRVIPRPPGWSGYRVAPLRIEFWEERPFRLHDRLVFLRDGQGWRTELLYP